jgi:hypothetical protein
MVSWMGEEDLVLFLEATLTKPRAKKGLNRLKTDINVWDWPFLLRSVGGGAGVHGHLCEMWHLKSSH